MDIISMNRSSVGWPPTLFYANIFRTLLHSPNFAEFRVGRMRTPFLCSLVLALTFGALSEARAHEDTLIRRKGTELVGLPANYAPAELDMQEFRLRIGKRELTFPPSIRELFKQPYDLRISASWYHDSATLPPYMLLHIQPKKKDFSYEVLLDLGTLQMIDFTLTLQIADGETWGFGVNRTEQWKKHIRAAIRIRN